VAASESFFIPGPAGRLEAVLMPPAGEVLAAAVVCPAHPLHGGMMHFKPVFRAAKALQSAGVAALRFNFRGVGRSEGEHDFGIGEQEDARAALFELERRFPGSPLALGGFSFGSSIALRVAVRDPRVQGVVALGYPFLSRAEAASLDEVRQPRLFVQGENDEFGPGEALRSLVGALAPPSEVVVVGGADHYFTGHLDALHAAVASWAARRPWRAGSALPERTVLGDDLTRPAARGLLMVEERRRSQRVAVDVPARLTIGEDTIEGRLRDICRDAALVEAARSYPLETKVRLEANLPRVAGTISAPGKVIRLAPGANESHGMAILFDDLPAEMALRIDLFVSEQEG
jgi:alpha/beta superfamily hydrolase